MKGGYSRLACLLLLVLFGLLVVEQAKARELGIMLAAEGVVSVPLQNKTVKNQQLDKIALGGRGGLQLGLKYGRGTLLARTRIGGSTLYSSSSNLPDLTLDILATYRLPLPAFKIWLGAGYSALWPSTKQQLSQRPDPYHGFVATVGNIWILGLFSEYSVAYYPHRNSAQQIRESITDITFSLGYRFSFP